MSESNYVNALSCFNENKVKEFVEIITQENFDIDHKYERGRTLLHQACYFKKIDFIILLIAFGANINLGNMNGTTPLMYAKTNILNKQYYILEYLVKNGALIDQKDNFGLTILDYLERNNDLITKKYITELKIQK